MSWRGTTSGVIILAAAVTGGGAAGAAVVQKHTPAGRAAARSALIGRAVFGRGWHVSATAPRSVPPLTCSAFDPHVARATEVGAAASATFAESSNGPFVAQVSYAYTTSAQRRAVWSAVVRPGLGRCLRASLVHGSTRGVTFKATGVRQLSLPGVPSQSTVFRVSGDATATDQSVPVYLDVIIVGRGTGISELSLSTFMEPAGHGLELRLARAISRRMAAGS
jgi:hypothetical protein